MATLAEELLIKLELWAQQNGGRENAALLIEDEWDVVTSLKKRYAKRLKNYILRKKAAN
jgi:hypothetical protein